MSGGTTTQDSQSTSVNQIPAWMTQAGQQNYGFAQQVAEQPLQQYQGQMVADVAPQTQQSWNVAANSGNVGADQYNAGTAGYLGALGQTPANVTAGQIADLAKPIAGGGGSSGGGGASGGWGDSPNNPLAGTGYANYMNPYTQSVINATLPGMQQANALSQNQQANAANSSNAFGGSRQGIQQGVAQAQGAQNIGLMMANLNNQNFQQAQAAATNDINRRLTADQGNQTAQQQKIQSDIAASQGLTNTGDSMNKANVANYNLLSSAGASQSMQAQNEINSQMAKFSQAFNYPQQQLGTLLSALGMTPHDTSTSGQQSQQTTTPTDWAGLIEGGAKTAASLFPMSDRSMKTDITKLGKDPKTGLDMHAFRYKGDPKSYPKVVGPMAQDVEKQFPGGTKRQGGKLTVDPSIMSPQGYAAGTPFVQPSLAGFVPKSSPGVATGISAMSAFRPPMKLPRGATVPKMQPQKFAFGSADVQAPDMNDVDLGMQIEGGGGISDFTDRAKAPEDSPPPARKPPPEMMKPPSSGWGAPSMGYAISGFARGSAQVPGFGSGDTVPSYLTPGEAVLTPGAAQHVGRPKIAALNAMHPPGALSTFMPPVASGQATTAMRAGARGIKGALANTKLRPKMAGGLSG